MGNKKSEKVYLFGFFVIFGNVYLFGFFRVCKGAEKVL